MLLEIRTGHQLYTSIKNYLVWRSGADWRPASHRFHPDRLEYLSAVNHLNAAFLASSPAPCACPYCNGSPFHDERPQAKPVRSVAVVTRRRTRA